MGHVLVRRLVPRLRTVPSGGRALARRLDFSQVFLTKCLPNNTRGFFSKRECASRRKYPVHATRGPRRHVGGSPQETIVFAIALVSARRISTRPHQRTHPSQGRIAMKTRAAVALEK